MNPHSIRKFLPFGFTRWECALALIVVGARLAVFSYAGSPLPYYDQWIAEFGNTLMSITMGQGFAALLNPHNEHLVLTTKMLTLLGYFINGYWDVPFLVVCSAAVRALTAAWTFQLISNLARPKTKALLWLLCAVLFTAPYSGFNLLNGMQVSFYLADCALLWSLYATIKWGAPITSGLALIGGTLFGVLSFGSAVAVPACTLTVHLFQRRARPGFWPAWLISGAIALGFIVIGKNTGAISSGHLHLPLQAAAHFSLQIIAWPIGLAPVGALLVSLCTIALVVAWKRDRERTAANAAILGLGVYAAVNAAFFAINRDPSQWHMRHWDTIAFLPLAVLALGLRMAELNIFNRPVLILTGVLALCYAGYAGNLIRTVSWPYIQAAHDTRSAALDHYRALLAQQDLHVECERINTLLENRDYSFFDDPIGRFSLHPVVIVNLLALHGHPRSLLSPEIIPLRSPSLFSWLTGRLIAYGWLLSLLGFGLGVTAIRREFVGSVGMSADTP